ncbi:hypothetical protein [Adhaeribacter rhizoryzae]|uniref:Cbb3-type cytochrome c oxidase subunit I n=1 Tax=Adhaeribacter rhizoryzae TaxID=2607907 RepID=A0A5M6DGV9_9BACT|nr:hypothetical protein [Adhaeribacter rhizoryzae]KAA5546761.1 hypothetical protein F0145_10515 [Adhaeribacter rhizoryzae]
MKNSWLKIALLNFVVIALLGLFLRWFMVSPPANFNYKYLLHAHSHVAILGWLFSAVFVALVGAYLPENMRQKKVYSWQFWLGQLTVLGMLISFPVQGYGLYSIIFSTLHIFISYWFIYQFQTDARQASLVSNRYVTSFRFIKAALIFLALSTLGPWSLGPIMATGGSGSQLYYNAIYFYLHFQYNGWLSFAALGLLFWLFEKHHLNINLRQGQQIFHLFFWSCCLGYLLSVLWIKPPAVVYYLAGLAAVAQGLGLVLFLQLLYRQRQHIAKIFTGWGSILFSLAMVAFVLKIMMQLASAIPFMADLAYTVRNFIIGYLHLVLIGFISFFLFAFFIQQKAFNTTRPSSRWGLGIFITGFFLSEILLFLQGLFFWANWGMLPAYFQVLFGVSTFLPIGLILFLIGQRQKPLVWQKQLVTPEEVL